MSEICLQCLNKINKTKDSKWRYILSWKKDLCEECGEYKRIVVVERPWSRAHRTIQEIIEGIQYRRQSKWVGLNSNE